MTRPPADRTAILIVRLWVEADAGDGFRARITQTFDSTSSEHAVLAAANPENLYAVVRTWVESFLASADR